MTKLIDVGSIVYSRMVVNNGDIFVPLKDISDAPTIDAVPVAHLADLLERWNWACAMCTHSVDCDKCGLNRCIDELKEIINSGARKDGDENGKCEKV